MKPKPDIEMLPLPNTLPDTADGMQLLSVVEDVNDDCKMHVIIGDAMHFAESWGRYLADVARVIARNEPEYLITARKDGDLFKAICDGFRKAAAHTR
jgi:hypothetical protein